MADLSASIVRPAASVRPHKTSDPSPTEPAPESTFTQTLERSVTKRATDEQAPEQRAGVSDHEREGLPSIELIPTASVTTLVDSSQLQAPTGRPAIAAERSASKPSPLMPLAIQSTVDSLDIEKALVAVGFEDHPAQINSDLSTVQSASTSVPSAKLDMTRTRSDLGVQNDAQPTVADATPRFVAEKFSPVMLMAEPATVTTEAVKSVEPSFALTLLQPDTNATANTIFGAVRYEAAAETPKFDVRTPVLSPAWPRELEHVARIIVNERISEAEIRLNPPELGPIDVTLKVEGDSTSISFHANVEETRGLLETHLPKLREALDAAGLRLEDTSITGGGAQRDSRGTRTAPTHSDALLIGPSDDSGSIVGGVLARGIPKTDRLIDTFA